LFEKISKDERWEDAKKAWQKSNKAVDSANCCDAFNKMNKAVEEMSK